MNTQLLSIKAKKFGVRLAALRQKKGLTTEVLSLWTGIANEKLQAIEQGDATITLPEIEIVALKLGFSTETLIAGELQDLISNKPDQAAVQHYAGLRDRMIALILRKTRLEQNHTIESVSANCGLEPNELDQFESGSKPVPLPVLELLCSEYQIPLFSLIPHQPETDSAPTMDVSTIKLNENMPADVIEFVNNPINLPYLELARKLSDLDAAKLRSIAEGLLEITY